MSNNAAPVVILMSKYVGGIFWCFPCIHCADSLTDREFDVPRTRQADLENKGNCFLVFWFFKRKTKSKKPNMRRYSSE
jgi:hypothetical protein